MRLELIKIAALREMCEQTEQSRFEWRSATYESSATERVAVFQNVYSKIHLGSSQSDPACAIRIVCEMHTFGFKEPQYEEGWQVTPKY